MSFLDTLTAFLPFAKKEEQLEYFFAINIGTEKIAAALWTVEGKKLKILNLASQDYSSLDEIITVVDHLLDQVLGLKEIEPQRILFGVPNSWLADDNLKEEYLKLLRSLVKELELTPMAYVATSNALIHFLEKQEGVPATAILVGFEKLYLTVTIVRAGKLDGVKVITRGESAGADIEKVLLTFTEVETLPSKILIYGSNVEQLKNQLPAFAWMSKLSFLHLPKIAVLTDEIPIKSVCLAGSSEMKEDIFYTDQVIEKQKEQKTVQKNSEKLRKPENQDVRQSNNPDFKSSDTLSSPVEESSHSDLAENNLGFVVGDVADKHKSVNQTTDESEESNEDELENVTDSAQPSFSIEEFEEKMESVVAPVGKTISKRFNFKKLIPKKFTALAIMLGLLGMAALLIGILVFLLKVNVKIYVEPKILEKDAAVVADPNQKTIDEANKIIPGQIVEGEVSGSAKDTASGKKQIGDPAKGTIILYNKTSEPRSLSKGAQVSGSGGIKFTLDTSVTIASQSASDSGITFGKVNAPVTAVAIGADGNLPSGSDFTVAGYSADKLTAKSEGNFSGGTSKDVTVVSSEDQQKLLASLASDLRKQAQQKLQEQYPNKKILAEALSENIVKKSYSKNINDQASEFSLSMTIRYKGTVFDDADLRTIVSKLVNTQVPDGFQLDISDTETQADVSELKKDGKVIFLARFKAKLLPKIDVDRVRSQIKFKTPEQVISMLRGMDNVLGAEIKLSPPLPKVLERLPIISQNLAVEVGLK